MDREQAASLRQGVKVTLWQDRNGISGIVIVNVVINGDDIFFRAFTGSMADALRNATEASRECGFDGL